MLLSTSKLVLKAHKHEDGLDEDLDELRIKLQTYALEGEMSKRLAQRGPDWARLLPIIVGLLVIVAATVAELLGIDTKGLIP